MKTTIYPALLAMCVLLMGIHTKTRGQEIDCPWCMHDTEEDDMPEVIYSGPKSPQFSENGNWFPATGTVNVLVIFAEVDRSLCGACASDGSQADAGISSEWLPGQLPQNIIEPGTGNDIFNKTYFDRTLPSGATPTPGSLTEFYYQMSFGQHIVLGDYYPELITVPCASVAQVPPNAAYNTLRPAVINIINARTLNTTTNPSGEFATKTGLTLSAFDKLGETNSGIPKPASANGNIDCIVIVWRNLQCNYKNCGGGLAVWAGQGSAGAIKQNVTTSYQTYIGGTWRACNGGTGMFKGEYMHGLFGGNYWHSGNNGGEPEARSFLNSSNTYGLTSYSLVGGLACAWDRYHLGWYGWKTNVGGTKKSSLISAKTTTQDEVPTDFNISASFPNGNEFILRDFITYGDAIRIKLPYINWASDGNVKNQYLWIENHQKISAYDNSGGPSSCKEPWSTGIYAYIQVGKDMKSDLTNMYSTIYPEGGTFSHPNGLGSWFFALTAEGNYDYKYRYDLAGNSTDDCVWGNNYLPVEKGSSETKGLAQNNIPQINKECLIIKQKTA